jgi:hypothetical protein
MSGAVEYRSVTYRTWLPPFGRTIYIQEALNIPIENFFLMLNLEENR